MGKIDTSSWKEFVIKDIFSVKRPPARSQTEYEEGVIPFVASGCFNNGVLKYLTPKPGETLDKGNCITVSPIDGSSFYQEIDFLGRGGAGSSVILLYNPKLNLYSGYFIATVIRAVCKKYAYSDMANKDTIGAEKIKLPVDIDGNPDFSYMEDYMRNLENAVGASLLSLQAVQTSQKKKIDVSNWIDFRIGDLFDKLDLNFIPDRRFNKAFDVSLSRTQEFNLPLVNAKHDNNGIMYYGRKEEWEFAEMALDIVQNGAISTGDVYAQPQTTGVLWDAYLIKPKFQKVTENILLYLASTIQSSIKSHFSYDDKCVWDKVKNEVVKLPSKFNQTGSPEPDWGYMEQYIERIKTKSNNVLLLQHAIS